MTPTEQQLNDAVERGIDKLFNEIGEIPFSNYTDTARNEIFRLFTSELKPLFDELVKDKERLDWLEQFFLGKYNNQHINYPAIPVRLHRDMPDWSIARGFGTLENAIGQGSDFRQAIDSAIQQEKGKKV